MFLILRNRSVDFIVKKTANHENFVRYRRKIGTNLLLLYCAFKGIYLEASNNAHVDQQGPRQRWPGNPPFVRRRRWRV